MTKEIVIAGNGVAGLSLAIDLASQPDVHTTVVAPGLQGSSQAVLSTRARISSPIISQLTADTIGIDCDQAPRITSAQFGLKDERGWRRRIRERINDFGQTVLARSPLHAVDSEKSRHQLLTRIRQLSEQEGTNITLVDGRVTGLQMNSNRVAGVLVEGQEEPISASLVVDATGRPARLASSLDVSQVTEKRKPQVSTILGGYVDLSDSQLQREFPGINTDLIVGVLPGKAIAILAPTEPIHNSTATHVLLIEGNPDSIRAAIKQAQDEPVEDRRDRRLAAIRILTRNTRWEQIVSQINVIDRTVLFTNRDSIYRQPQVAGLALVGDAQGYVNPINGTGFGFIAADVKRLVECIASNESLDGAVQTYNAEMKRVFSKRQRRSQRIFRAIQLVQWIFK